MGTLFPRIKCPGGHICLGKSVQGDGHFILGFCVWEDTFRGDTIYYDTGTVILWSASVAACTSLGVLLMVSLTTRSTPLTSTVVPGM